jgi:hypothetical protein
MIQKDFGKSPFGDMALTTVTLQSTSRMSPPTRPAKHDTF